MGDSEKVRVLKEGFCSFSSFHSFCGYFVNKTVKSLLAKRKVKVISRIAQKMCN